MSRATATSLPPRPLILPPGKPIVLVDENRKFLGELEPFQMNSLAYNGGSCIAFVRKPKGQMPSSWDATEKLDISIKEHGVLASNRAIASSSIISTNSDVSAAPVQRELQARASLHRNAGPARNDPQRPVRLRPNPLAVRPPLNSEGLPDGPVLRPEQLGARALPPSGIIPDKSKKKYCSYWIRTGLCDFTQQGCMYKHDMTDQALRDLGMKAYPKWWLEKKAREGKVVIDPSIKAKTTSKSTALEESSRTIGSTKETYAKDLLSSGPKYRHLTPAMEPTSIAQSSIAGLNAKNDLDETVHRLARSRTAPSRPLRKPETASATRSRATTPDKKSLN